MLCFRCWNESSIISTTLTFRRELRIKRVAIFQDTRTVNYSKTHKCATYSPVFMATTSRQTCSLRPILLLQVIGDSAFPHCTAPQGITQLCEGRKWVGWWCLFQPSAQCLLKKCCRATWNEQGHTLNFIQFPHCQSQQQTKKLPVTGHRSEVLHEERQVMGSWERKKCGSIS